jgi:hypothetical protein
VKMLLILTGLFVTCLAIVAGAISFAHMRELASPDLRRPGWRRSRPRVSLHRNVSGSL